MKYYCRLVDTSNVSKIDLNRYGEPCLYLKKQTTFFDIFQINETSIIYYKDAIPLFSEV